jgi:hypothetical protein
MLIKAGALAIAAVLASSGLATLTVGSGLALFSDQANNAGSSLTSASCFPGDTGFLDASADAADSGGDNDGFELYSTFAYADGSYYAQNLNGPGDRHRYYDYNIAVDGECAIEGIEVRLDWWLSTTLDTNSMSVELSWDGGASWTTAKTDTQESTSEHTAILGGPSDTWGRTWAVSELSNANFRVRLTCNCSGSLCGLRDFYLEWVPIRVYYGPS